MEITATSVYHGPSIYACRSVIPHTLDLGGLDRLPGWANGSSPRVLQSALIATASVFGLGQHVSEATSLAEAT